VKVKAGAGRDLGITSKQKNVYEYFVDNDYINLMNIKLLAGRNFDPRIAADTQTAVIINEAMMNDFGWAINRRGWATAHRIQRRLEDAGGDRRGKRFSFQAIQPKNRTANVSPVQ
jgi:hypothetical protein